MDEKLLNMSKSNETDHETAREIARETDHETRKLSDVAIAIYEKHKYQYVCTSLKFNNWYRFGSPLPTDNLRNYRWIPMDLSPPFKKWISEIISVDSQDKIDDVCRDCYKLFYDKDFIKKLDSNPNLIGFENGIFDLRTGLLKVPSREDYVSLSTGYDYKEFYDEDDEKFIIVRKILRKLFPNQKRQDVLNNLRSFLFDYKVRGDPVVSKYPNLFGDTPSSESKKVDKIAQLWFGEGSGKSTLMTLLKHVLGDYSAVMPSQMITVPITPGYLNLEMRKIKGVRLLFLHEIHESFIMIENIQSLTKPIVLRGLFFESTEFAPLFKIVLCNNKIPRVIVRDETINEYKYLDTSCSNYPFDLINFENPTAENEFIDMNMEDIRAFMYLLLNGEKSF